MQILRLKPLAFPKNNAGFTLMELLVVVAVLGLLMGLVASNYLGYQAKARDARRKSDLAQISRALELYYNDYSSYPDDSSSRIAGCGSSGTTACPWGTTFQDANTVYMDIIPDERMEGFNYVYNSDAAGGNLRYQLFAHLENENDPVLDRDNDGDADEYSSSCGDDNCNYAVTSPNTDGTASF